MKIKNLLFPAALLAHVVAMPIDDTRAEISDTDFTDEDFAEYYKNDILEFEFSNDVDETTQVLHERAAAFIPPGRGKDRVIHNKRLGAIAVDINVGCHSGISAYINGVDYFPNYIIEVHGCVAPHPNGRESASNDTLQAV